MSNRLLTGVLLAAVLALTVIVVAGIGQGSAPHKLPITASAEMREVAAVHAGSAQVKQGEALFSAHGCNACHTLAAGGYGGRLGPRLDVQSQGDSAHDVLGNIVHPPDDDKGYESGLMPEDYGTRLTHADLSAIAEYIATAAGGAAGK